MRSMIIAESGSTEPAVPPDLGSRIFSANLRDFHERLAAVHWREEARSCVFVRDYDDLPDRAPFDIDIMVDRSELKACREIFERLADKSGLVCVARNVPSGLHILMLDPVVAPTHRTWSYYEVATDKKMTGDFRLSARAIAVQHDKGLPVPDRSWRFLIEFLQALRKGDIDRYRQSLESELAAGPDCLNLCASTLGLSAAEIRELLHDPAQLDQTVDRIGVARKPRKRETKLRLKTRLRRAALRHLYFLPSPKMYTYTIHGADGVGKSTACNLVREIFSGYPISLDSAHHVTSWKRRQSPTPSAVSTDVSFIHRILRVIYRVSPQFAKDIWVTGSGYHHYSKNVNAEVYRSYIDRKILLLDRYIYDLAVKETVRQTNSLIGNWLSWLHCFLMRRPSLAILLQDDPGEIIKRKQELNEKEIRAYQFLMRKMLQRFRVRFERIEVGGRAPDEIGRDVAVAIIQNIGLDLHALMRDRPERAVRKTARGALV